MSTAAVNFVAMQDGTEITRLEYQLHYYSHTHEEWRLWNKYGTAAKLQAARNKDLNERTPTRMVVVQVHEVVLSSCEVVKGGEARTPLAAKIATELANETLEIEQRIKQGRPAFDTDPGLTVSTLVSNIRPVDPRSGEPAIGQMVTVKGGAFAGLIGHIHAFLGAVLGNPDDTVVIRQGEAVLWEGRR